MAAAAGHRGPLTKPTVPGMRPPLQAPCGPRGPSNVRSVTVRSGSSVSHREIISRGTLRGKMALASASLS